MDADRIMGLINRSPELAGKHDRTGWLDLFSSDGVVEDPVGAGPFRKGREARRGTDALGRFYDVFIGPNRIRFQVHRDILAGDEVVRDVTIHTVLSNGAVTAVHCHLLLRVVEENGRLRIESLRAHWDFGRGITALVRGNGFRGLGASLRQLGAMIRIQGPGRVAGYLGVLYRGILKQGARAVRAFAAAVNEGDEAALGRLMNDGATVELPVGDRPRPWSTLLDGRAGAAGPAPAGEGGLKLEIDGLRSGGWVTSGAFTAAGPGSRSQGVVFFEFDPRSRRIARVRFFAEQGPS